MYFTISFVKSRLLPIPPTNHVPVVASAIAVVATDCIAERPSQAVRSTDPGLLAIPLQLHLSFDWLVGASQLLTSLQLRRSQVAKKSKSSSPMGVLRTS